jgi:S-adenosylmethionine synthetase
VLDQFLREDPQAHAIVECAVSTGVVFVAARYRSRTMVDIPHIARQVIREVGYDDKDFNARTSSILTSLNELPPETPGAAKNVVAAGLADECEVLLSYTIGQARPVSAQVETFGTGRVSDTEIGARLEAQFDFRPAAIVRAFNLRQLPALTKGGFYRRLAAYGHVGRMDIGLPWERTDKTAVLGAL